MKTIVYKCDLCEKLIPEDIDEDGNPSEPFWGFYVNKKVIFLADRKGESQHLCYDCKHALVERCKQIKKGNKDESGGKS